MNFFAMDGDTGNAQLRKLVADQALDISILKVAAEGNF
jgi:hypothetical protein